MATMSVMSQYHQTKSMRSDMRMVVLFLVVVVVGHLPLCLSFMSPPSSLNLHLPRQQLAASSSKNNNDEIGEEGLVSSQQRRKVVSVPFIASAVGAIFTTALVDNKPALAAEGQLRKLLDQIKEGRQQLEDDPELIKAEKWDSGACYENYHSCDSAICICMQS